MLVQRRRGSARFTPTVGAAAGDAVSGVGLTASAEVADNNLSISPPTSVLPPDISIPPTHEASGANDILNNFEFDWGNANADFELTFPALRRTLMLMLTGALRQA